MLMIESPDEFAVFDALYDFTGMKFVWLNCHDMKNHTTWVCEIDADGTETSYRSEYYSTISPGGGGGGGGHCQWRLYQMRENHPKK